jgi:hypothetical protein
MLSNLFILTKKNVPTYSNTYNGLFNFPLNLKEKKHSISNRNAGIAAIRNYMFYYTCYTLYFLRVQVLRVYGIICCTIPSPSPSPSNSYQKNAKNRTYNLHRTRNPTINTTDRCILHKTRTAVGQWCLKSLRIDHSTKRKIQFTIIT